MQRIPTPEIRRTIEEAYRRDSRRILATLIRVLGDFDLAEEAMQEAFRAAVEQWPRDGVPENPRAWLISAGRFKAIDAIRRRVRFDASQLDIAETLHGGTEEAPIPEHDGLEDDRLRLIFTCCHPALPREAQVALTLREVCDLTTEEIAHAFLTSPATLAQRIVRAKAKIKADRIPYAVPSGAERSARLDNVLRVIYLVFNEGYAATFGESVTRRELSQEAIRLGRLLAELLPEPEVLGLLALMVLQESRWAARLSPSGDLLLLDEQDRSRWDQALIAEGMALVARVISAEKLGPYTLQAAIAAVHARAPSAADTDWAEIVALYDLLEEVEPTPVVALNRAVAIGMRDGPEAGLAMVDALIETGGLAQYRFAHAAKADMCRRLGRLGAARRAYTRAFELCPPGPDRRFLERRLAELGEHGPA